MYQDFRIRDFYYPGTGHWYHLEGQGRIAGCWFTCFTSTRLGDVQNYCQEQGWTMPDKVELIRMEEL